MKHVNIFLKLLFISFWFPVNLLSAVSEIIWTKTYGNIATYSCGFGIVCDNSDNIYVVGATSTGVNGVGVLIAKYDQNGTLIWSRTYNSPISNKYFGFDVAIDSINNVYVVASSMEGYSYIWTAKYSPDGLLMWATTYHNIEGYPSRGFGIDVDSQGNVYVVGVEGSSGGFLFLRKYDTNGNHIRTVNAYNYPYTDWSFPYLIQSILAGVTVNNDIVWVTGGTEYYLYLQKYTTEGLLQYTTFFLSNTGIGYRIKHNSKGDLYITGCDTSDKHFVLKANKNGEFIWQDFYLVSTSSYNITPFLSNGIDIDSFDNIYVVNSGLSGLTPWDINQTYMEIRKYDSTDNLIWKTTYVESSEGEIVGFDVAVSKNGYFYVVGGKDYSGTYNLWVRKYLDSIKVVTRTIHPEKHSYIHLLPESGLITIEILPNTFSEEVNVVAEYVSNFLVSNDICLKATNVGLAIGIDKLVQPQKEVTITIKYRDSDVAGMNENNLVIARYDDTNKSWVKLPSTAYPEENKVVATTTRLSKFQLMERVAANNLRSVYCFPNPFKSSEGHVKITFVNLTDYTNLKIFNIAGELVYSEEKPTPIGKMDWYVKNHSGERVASGVYIYLITNNKGKNTTGKLAIIW